LAIVDGLVSMRVDHDWCRMAHICIRRGFCEGQNQKAKVLKIAANSYRSLVLNSRAGAHKLHISDRKPDHKVEGVYNNLWNLAILSNTTNNGFECVNM
jgi:hypothetical protein